MKDFKSPNLYKLEQGTFETFVDSMLETNTEYNQSGRLRTGLVEEEEESAEYFGSIDDWGSSGGMDDFNFDFSSGLDNFSSDTTNTLVNPRGYSVEEMGTLRMLLTAPIYAFKQTGDAIINTKKVNPATRKKIAKDWRIWGLTLGGFSVLGLFPFVTSFIYLPVGIGMLASSGLADYYYGKQGGESIIAKLVNGDESDFEGDEEGDNREDDGSEDGLGMGSSDMGFGDFGGFSDFGGLDSQDDSFNDRYAEFAEDEGDKPADDYYDPEAMGALASDYFPDSPIETDTTEMFREGLIDVFKSGVSQRGKMMYKREDIIKYYAKYMPNNDKAFARWTSIKEHSPEYDNIAYTIYKSLVSVDGKFDMRNAVPKGEKLTVMDMKRTPLIYKITVKLPSYFKINSVTNQANIFNDMLKSSDDDEKVGTILTTYGGDLVIKFLRLDYKKLVSMGDLLRLSDESATESFAEKFATSSGIPMVAGMRDNEYPYMVDIVGNPAATVVGGSGSGKSWLTFQFMDSMLIANNPLYLNFLILDAKDASIWKQFALAPHVLGYHSDYHDFISILMEVKAEHERRMKELSRMGIESWKDYSNRCQRNGDHEKLAEMPLLFVIIDEITYTMSSLQNEDIDQYKELKNLLTQLSSVIRASGIRMLLIGQRAIDTSIPKGYLANSPLKLTMKLNVQSDFTTMLGKGYEREVSRIPSGPGEGIMLAEGQAKSSYVKTVIPGGKSDEDITMQVRVMSLDWVRRTQGTNHDYTAIKGDMSKTIKKGFNRDMYYNQALVAIEDGKITSPGNVDEDYLIAINSPNANLVENAVENVERKMGNQPKVVQPEPEVPVNVREPERDIPVLDDIDWDSLIQEPEESEPYEAETASYEPELEEPDYDEYAEEDYTEVEGEEEVDEWSLEETVNGTGDDDVSVYEPSMEMELYTEPAVETDNTPNTWETEEPQEFELEDYGVNDQQHTDTFEIPDESVGLTDDEHVIEPDAGIELEEYEPEKGNDTPQEPEEMDFSMSLEDIFAQEAMENETETKPEIAEVGDISTMLDIATETFSQEPEEDYENSEEYIQFQKEQEELAEVKRKQQEMLDKLQQLQKEQQRESAEAKRQQEAQLAQEAKRKAEQVKLKQQRDAERKKKLAEEKQKLQEQKDELEKQKQEILLLQQKLDESKQVKVPVKPETKPLAEHINKTVTSSNHGLTPEPRQEKQAQPKPAKGSQPKEGKQETPVKKAPTQAKPKGVTKETPKEEPKAESKSEPAVVRSPKPVKRKKVETSLKDVKPNTVNYSEMENMSVGQYIAKFGEVSNGQRRIESEVIKAKFNRRKVSLALAIGEVYETGEYLYYAG